MAVSKQELTKSLIQKHSEAIAKLETLIDKHLDDQFDPGEWVRVELPIYPNGAVREELARRYSEQGWSIAFRNDWPGPRVELR